MIAASTIQSLRNRLQELEAAELPPQESRTSTAPPSIRAPGRGSPSPELTAAPNSGVNKSTGPLAEPSARTPSILNPVPRRDPPDSGTAPSCRQTLNARDASPLPFVEPRSFEKMMEPLIGEQDGSAEPTIGWPVGPAHSVLSGAQNAKLHCTCDLSLDTADWSLPLRRASDALVDDYFSRFHRLYPFLHQPTFRRQYERLWALDSSAMGNNTMACSGLCRQKSRGRLFPAMLHAVFALATLTIDPGSPGKNAHRAEEFFRHTQAVDLLNVPDDEVGIELIQLGLLMGFYLQSTEKFSRCWNITYLTIRIAKNIGLELSVSDPRRRDFFAWRPTQLDCEIRSRVWHGCIVLERYLSFLPSPCLSHRRLSGSDFRPEHPASASITPLAAGVSGSKQLPSITWNKTLIEVNREVAMSFGCPSMITTSDTKSRLPEAIDDARLSSEPGKWNSQPEGHPSLLQSYVQTIKLYNILGRVLNRDEPQVLLSARDSKGVLSEAATKVQAILELDTSITEWRDSLPDYLQYHPDSTKCSQAGGVAADELSIPSVDLFIQAKRLYLRYESILSSLNWTDVL